MPDDGNDVRRISWIETFPFIRLFRTFSYSTHWAHLALAFAAVAGCYLVGRALDAMWVPAGGGVLQAPAEMDEVEAYASQPYGEFVAWTETARLGREALILESAIVLKTAEAPEAALEKLEREGEDALLDSPDLEARRAAALALIDDHLDARLQRIEADATLTESQKDAVERRLYHAADYLRLLLHRKDVRLAEFDGGQAEALRLLQPVGEAPTTQTQQDYADLAGAVAQQLQLNAVHATDPTGPFAALMDYEMRCFAAAVRGVCTFNWGFGGGALDPEPSLLGSILSAGRGVAWLVTQRPCFAVICGLLHLVIFSFFAGAICRHAAIQIARDETISLGQSLRFAREKFFSLVSAPLIPLAVMLAIGVVLWVAGLIAAIPYLGELLAGILYFLALLGGFAMAMVFLALVLGVHIMWPTIAVEGSDALDAMTHGISYISQRAWHAAFYAISLLLYGAVTFVFVRLVALLLLKFTHAVTNAGMSLFGAWDSAATDTITKLDAMWHMPAWRELPFLPSLGGMPFWGTFYNAPLNGTEWLATFLIACWVFLLVVTLVGGYVVSFYCCGSTIMYFLLRRDVDAVDYEEVYFEEDEEEPDFMAPGAATAAGAGAPGGGVLGGGDEAAGSGGTPAEPAEKDPPPQA